MSKITKTIFGLLGQVSRTTGFLALTGMFAVGSLPNSTHAQVPMTPKSNPTYNETVDWPSETVDPYDVEFASSDAGTSQSSVVVPMELTASPLPPWADSEVDYVSGKRQVDLADPETTPQRAETIHPLTASVSQGLIPQVSVPWRTVSDEVGFVAPKIQTAKKLVAQKLVAQKEAVEEVVKPRVAAKAQVSLGETDAAPVLESVLEVLPANPQQVAGISKQENTVYGNAHPDQQRDSSPIAVAPVSYGNSMPVTPRTTQASVPGYPLQGRTVHVTQQQLPTMPSHQAPMARRPVRSVQQAMPRIQAPRVGARYPLGNTFR